MLGLKYRPELDGLRAIAVISVMIYHLKLSLFDGSVLSGGFLGVDVFFVLSGFLISQLIFKEILNVGSFSFKDFYFRRAKRILPPLLFMIIVSGFISLFILLPTELTRFFESSIASIAFYSNVYWFFKLTEYGAQSGLLQPLLHTWSLSIEEQFYLFYPLFVVLVFKIKKINIKYTLFTLTVLFFIISIITTQTYQYLSFYSPISRAWELLAGAFLGYVVFNSKPRNINFFVAEVITILSLITLVMLFSLVNLSEVNHPGLATLPIVISTLGLIWFASSAKYSSLVLTNQLFQKIGKLSYSLYLWHFPVFAFGRHLSLKNPSVLDIVVWVLLTIVLSLISYKLVETPFRYKLSNRSVFYSLGGTSSVILALFVIVVSFNGLPQRFGELRKIYETAEIDNEKLGNATWEILSELSHGDIAYKEKKTSIPTDFEINSFWFSERHNLKVLVVGNSHATDVFNALYLNKKALSTYDIARFGMNDMFPSEQVDLMLETKNFKAADVILIAPRYSINSFDRLTLFVKKLKEFNKRIVLFGHTAEFNSPGPQPIFDWYIQKHKKLDVGELNKNSYDFVTEKSKVRDALVKNIANDLGVEYFSRQKLMCNDYVRSCYLATPDGKKTMFDFGHWTLNGAKFFGEKLSKEEFLN